MSGKPKVAFYWCASCGGCEEAVVDLGPALLDVADKVEIVLWPVAMDFKYSDVEALEDGAIAASFVNGAVRTSEQAEIARLLRRKSGLVFAFGACATDGGIPALANLTSRAEVFRTSYLESETVVNAEGRVPLESSEAFGLDAALPAFWDRVHALDQVVEVDYHVPGCPPTPEVIGAAVAALLEGRLPARGARLASSRALCDECPRREAKSPHAVIEAIRMPHEVVADPERCLLEQGLLCCGPATRGGCGALCVRANMPCTGCFGPPEGVEDQGVKMLSAVASLLPSRTKAEAEAQAFRLLDAAGTFNRYSLARSILGRSRREEP